MKDRLKRLFNSTAFCVVLSILLAVLWWLNIAYFNNDSVTIDIYNVPINIVGEEALEEKGLIVTSVSMEKIDLKISGRPSEVTRISHKDVSVTVDLEDITSISSGVGAYQLLYTIKYPDSVNANYLTVESASADYITVKVENFVTKNVPIRVEYNSVIPEGYRAEPVAVKQENIVVSGPESVVSRISYALVSVDAAELTDTYNETLPYSLRSETDEFITSDLLTYSTEKVDVTIPLIMTKEVPLIVSLKGFNSAQESNCNVTISPSSIVISGSPTKINAISNITVATVDLTSFVSEFSADYDINLGTDITNESGITQASVKVVVSGLSTHEVMCDNFEIINNKTGREVNIVSTAIVITFRGTRSSLSDIDESKITIQANLDNIKDASGTYSVPAIISVEDAKGVDAVGTYTVTVMVS